MYYDTETSRHTESHCYRAADLRFCFNICKSRFSHDTAYVIILYHDRLVEAVRCILGYPGAIHFETSFSDECRLRNAHCVPG